MKEREAKLEAPPGFELPELGRPGDGFSAEPQAARRLRTTYYDTADLRLARWGRACATGPARAGRSSCPRARRASCWSGPSTPSPGTGAGPRPRRGR